MKALSLLAPALLVSAAPAFANVTVSSPVNGALVVSPFTLAATASPCSAQPIAAMGYSFDNSSNTTIVNGTSVNAHVTGVAGAHILHIKSWGNQGASCVANIAISILPSPSAIVPSNAVAVTGIHTLKTWQAAFDSGTGNGSAIGTMGLIGSPSVSGTAREFLTTYTNFGGERYSALFGSDSTATNFLYDTWMYLASPTNDIANIEMDLNQVMSNGQTVIFGFQCNGWSGTWDYTTNAGTPQTPKDLWLHSTSSCNPRAWTTNTWHHVQIQFSRDNQGNVTYRSVWFDGAEQVINAKVPSAFALGWGPALLTNFQVDGIGGTGSAIVYLDNLTVYRW
jgi:hypothetical protein